jgi:hypothetical protein
MGIEQPRTRIAHLLRRAGFGGADPVAVVGPGIRPMALLA